jgi:hypothetical protein
MSDKPSTPKGGEKVVTTSRPIVLSADSYVQSLERVAKLDKRVKEEKFDPKKHKDTKRAHIAMIFVWGYMITIATIVVGAPVFNATLAELRTPIDIERVLSQVGSLIGAPLGFVIGYYFKEDR